MTDTSTTTAIEEVFGPVIYRYTRAQALADGVLVDISELAREAGFTVPLAITAAAWQDCVAWRDEDSRTQVYQDETGRLWDVVFMAAHAIRTRREDGAELEFELYRIPRDGHSREAESALLKLMIGPGDAGEPVMTLLMPDED